MPSLGELVAPRRLGTDFRWLLGSSWTSNLGDGIALSAAPLLIASLTSSPILVASGAVMQFWLWLLFGLFTAVLVAWVLTWPLPVAWSNVATNLLMAAVLALKPEGLFPVKHG